MAKGKHGIDYKKVRVYFIYSFLLEFKEGRDFEDFIQVLELDPFDPEKLPKDLKKVEKNKWYWCEPLDRKGVAPTLRIMRKKEKKKENSQKDAVGYLPHTFYRSQCFSAEIPEKGKDKVRLEITTRIADSGGGVIAISVETQDSEVDLAKVYQIIQLQELTETENENKKEREKEKKAQKLHLVEDGVDKTIFELFHEEITKLAGEVKDIAQWVDREVVNEKDPNGPFQNPFTVIACEVDTPLQWRLDETFFKENEKEKREKEKIEKGTWFAKYYWWNGDSKHLHKEAASLMLRMINGVNVPLERIPEECQDPHNPERLRNFAWDSRIFIGFQRRSCLLMCPSFEHKPAQFLLPSLVDMMEMLRTRWHGAIVINALLDRDMKLIKGYKSRANFMALQRFVRRRRQFALLLRDPIPYAFEGASITEISEVAQKKLWIKELLEKTAMKLDTVAKLMEEEVELAQVRSYLTEDFG